jgi:hypothetical protein
LRRGFGIGDSDGGRGFTCGDRKGEGEIGGGGGGGAFGVVLARVVPFLWEGGGFWEAEEGFSWLGEEVNAGLVDLFG